MRRFIAGTKMDGELRYKNQVTLVTGSNGALGLSIVRGLIENGYTKVACHYHNGSEKIEALLKEKGLDKERYLFQARLEDEHSVVSLKDAITARLGSVRHLINVAGASTSAVIWKISVEDYYRVINANLTSTLLCTKHFIPPMREVNSGRIVNVSSVLGLKGGIGVAHYAAAKAGIIGFTKSTALECSRFGINANVLALGYFEAGLIEHIPIDKRQALVEQIPLGRFGNPHELWMAVDFLLSPGASYMTGETINLNGGLHM